MSNNRLNDGKVDNRRRFVAGAMDTMTERPNGALCRLDPDFALRKLDDGIIVSDGSCRSADGAAFDFAGARTGEIWAYDGDQATGAAANRRTFVKVDSSRGGAAACPQPTISARATRRNLALERGRNSRDATAGVESL